MIRPELERNLVAVSDKPYELSILTYALHLLKSDYVDDAFAMLEALKVNEGIFTKFLCKHKLKIPTKTTTFIRREHLLGRTRLIFR